jgi:hypothetical protein
MSGAIPPLPNTPSLRGAQLKHRDNFTFTFNVEAGSATEMKVSSSILYLPYRNKN